MDPILKETEWEFMKAALTSIGTVLMIDRFGSQGDLYAILLYTPLFLIFGEIVPKSVYQRKAESLVPVIEDRVYLLHAQLPISEVTDVIGLNLSSDDYRTVGGMLLAHLRHVPKEGEDIVDSGYRFTVTEATEKSAVRVRAEPEA